MGSYHRPALAVTLLIIASPLLANDALLDEWEATQVRNGQKIISAVVTG